MNLGELRAAVAVELVRPDVTDAQIDRWLNNASTRVSRLVRLPGTDTVSTLTVTSGAVTIPTDLLELRALYIDDEQLEKTDYQRFLKVDATCDAYVYTKVGTAYKIRGTPADATEVSCWYYRTPTVLVSDTDEDTIHEMASDVILYGALVEAGGFVLDERRGVWSEEFNQRAQDLLAYLRQSELAEGPMSVSPYFGEPY